MWVTLGPGCQNPSNSADVEYVHGPFTRNPGWNSMYECMPPCPIFGARRSRWARDIDVSVPGLGGQDQVRRRRVQWQTQKVRILCSEETQSLSKTEHIGPSVASDLPMGPAVFLGLLATFSRQKKASKRKFPDSGDLPGDLVRLYCFDRSRLPAPCT